MPESSFSPSNHCFGINKIDRSDVLNGLNSSACSSTAKLFTTKTNTITKPSLFIPGRDSVKQSVKTGTSLVGGKCKIKQWKITKAKGTKFSDRSRCIKIRLGSLLQRGINWGEKVRKGGELTYKCSGINTAKIAILKFTKGQSNIAIHLQIDNKTVLSYVLKMGGTHNRELLHISKSIWSYLLSKQTAMSAEYLSSALNVHADWESRNAKDYSEWKLDASVFQEIVTHMGQPTLDLLASRLSHQLPRYIAWKLGPCSIARDAFLDPWDREYSFAFPPFSLISRILRKILQEKIDHLIIVTLTWQTQPWYAQLLKMSVQPPFFLPHIRNLLANP